MRQDTPRDAYRDAYNEAYSELRKIFGEVERLRIRRDRVAKLVEVLNKRFGFQAQIAMNSMTWESQVDGLSVVTHVASVLTTPKIED
jgi:hypothetical protein